MSDSLGEGIVGLVITGIIAGISSCVSCDAGIHRGIENVCHNLCVEENTGYSEVLNCEQKCEDTIGKELK